MWNEHTCIIRYKHKWKGYNSTQLQEQVMSTKDILMEIEQEVECHLQCETIQEVFDRVMQTAVSQYGEVLVGSVVEQLWSDYSLNSYYKHREE